MEQISECFLSSFIYMGIGQERFALSSPCVLSQGDKKMKIMLKWLDLPACF